MASSPPRSSPSKTLLAALSYSDNFDYPLSLQEIWYWQPYTRYPTRSFPDWPHQKNHLYYLPGRQHLVDLRQKRLISSGIKWKKALSIAKYLQLIPSISAIFVTGSLAMRNSPENDDIDFMVITSPHTLWLTRVCVVIFLRLFNIRRSPRLATHSSPKVCNKICDNLYLDLKHLEISHNPHNKSQSFYLAHEILQAKCIFDRRSVHHRFIIQNSWVKEYLPMAYHESVKQFPNPTPDPNSVFKGFNPILFILNAVFFLAQYLYMRPHLTREKISLGFAFFHPRLLKLKWL